MDLSYSLPGFKGLFGSLSQQILVCMEFRNQITAVTTGITSTSLAAWALYTIVGY